METITVGFSKPKNMTLKPYAWLIMKAYSTPFDHVYIQIYSQKYDRYLIYQASSRMVNFMGRDLFAKNNVVVDQFEVEITPENKTLLMKFAIDKAGTPYGVL